MSKKSLNGFLKTRHFKERQRERGVADRDVIQAIREGTLVETDQGHHFSLGHLKVTVNVHKEVLVTVHPGDPGKCTNRVLSREEARRLIKQIEELRAVRPASETTDDFLAYAAATGVKKL
jgi:hypothetical protein